MTGRMAPGGQLRPRELALLRLLWEREGLPVPAEELLSRVWGRAPDGPRGVLYTTLRRLREALEPDPSRPRHVVTRREGVVLVRELAPPGTLLRDEGTPLVGRSSLLEWLTGSGRRVHLIGLPGIGRARVAREAARRLQTRLPGGLWGVPAADAEHELARQLGVEPAGLQRRLRRLPPALVVVHGLGPEHADLLRRWVRWGPSLRVWSTGTAPLAGVDEVQVVQPLSREEAVELARAAVPMGLEAPEGLLARLVEAVGGVPEALLAGVPLVATVGLEAALAVLCTPEGALGRVAAAWASAYPEHVPLLRALRAYESFTLDDLAHVVEVPEPERWLPILRAAGLVRPVGGRLALAPLLQRALDPEPEARARHLVRYSALAAARVEGAGGRVPDVARDDAERVGEWLRASHTALDTGEAGHGTLIELAIRYARRTGRRSEGAALYERARSAELPARDRVRLWLLDRYAWSVPGDLMADEARRQGDIAAALSLRVSAAADHWNRGDTRVAADHLDVAEQWLQGEVPDRVRAATEARVVALRAVMQHDDRLYEQAYRSARAASLVVDASAAVRTARFQLAQVEARRWRLAEATRLLGGLLEGVERRSPGSSQARPYAMLAAMYARAGDAEAARRALDRADSVPGRGGPIPAVEERRARTLLALGQRSEAAVCARVAREAADRDGDIQVASTAWCTELLADPSGAEQALPLLLPELLAHRDVEGAVEMASLAFAEHLAGRLDDIRWVVERLDRHELGSLAVEWCTALAELPAHRDAARELALRLPEVDDRPRVAWLSRWLAAEAGDRVRPAFDDSPDPWVAIYQARLWRLLGREVQVGIELRRVPELLTEPLLLRARRELLMRLGAA